MLDLKNERDLVDIIDDKIIVLLKERFIITNQIGVKKRKENKCVFDYKRYTELIIKYSNYTEVYDAIHLISVKKQSKK